MDPGERERLLVELVSAGLVEEYEAGDAGGRTSAAIRVQDSRRTGLFQ